MQLPNRSVRHQRYEGRPLLRLLDSYVLALTGHLDRDTEIAVEVVVEKTFGARGDWMQTLVAATGLPPDMSDRIRALWHDQPSGTDPFKFAIAVSDENFSGLIDPE